MAEYIETLKRMVDAQRNTAMTHGVRLELPLDQVNTIIAALEDRDRLRLMIERLTSGEAVHEMATALALAEQDRERLREVVKALALAVFDENWQQVKAIMHTPWRSAARTW